MPKFPYMNFPFPYYNSKRFQSSYANVAYSADRLNNKTVGNITNEIPNSFAQDSLRVSSFDSPSDLNRLENCKSKNKKNKSNTINTDYLFDLFGIKIYTDDVLLVSLIYFLYSENVKDEGLFIVLILLLLS